MNLLLRKCKCCGYIIDLSKDKYGYKSMWIYRILDLHDNIICIQCDRNLKLKRILK